MLVVITINACYLGYSGWHIEFKVGSEIFPIMEPMVPKNK